MATYNCNGCPYFAQSNGHLNIEQNNSKILLVFQAPGNEEWIIKKPLQPTIKKGGTAGRRIELSWKSKGKNRTDFDITNVVQCYPSKGSGSRDLSPKIAAICCCSKMLEQDIIAGNYKKIIAFGNIAQDAVKNIKNKNNLPCNIVNSTHPTGRVAGSYLDNLW